VDAFREPSATALREAVESFRTNEPWLLCIDQFEHLFTRTQDRTKRDLFIAAVAELAAARLPEGRLVLALRDEFFSYLQEYAHLFPLTDRSLTRIVALDRAVLREVIERPAAERGVAFDPGLVDEIIDEVVGQPGVLPLLQYTLDTLWKREQLDQRRLRRSTYRGIGGVRSAVGERFQKLYAAQDPAGQSAFRA